MRQARAEAAESIMAEAWLLQANTLFPLYFHRAGALSYKNLTMIGDVSFESKIPINGKYLALENIDFHLPRYLRLH